MTFSFSSGVLAIEEIAKYQEQGFSVEYPSAWNLSSKGNTISGNLSIEGSCARVFIDWTRDPGIDLSEILKNIRGAYDGGDVMVISSRQDEISMAGQKSQVLTLNYEFQGYSAQKLFAIWNSSSSDRLFLASISACSMDESRPLFEQLVASFKDELNGEPLRLEPKSNDEVWSLLVGDLLSSYHYRDASTLPPRRIHVQVMHVLTPSGGTYKLDSRETVVVDPFQVSAGRAGAVQGVFNNEGYDTRLVQAGGQIRVAVLDPLGRWRSVSINPLHPDRAVGVLVDEFFEGLAYENIEKLAEGNLPHVSQGSESSAIQKDCEPSRRVELKKPSDLDTSWLEELQSILDAYEYEERYHETVFDCSDTSQISWSILHEKGYDSRLMLSWDGHPLEKHMWVVVRYPQESERYVAVETANTDGSMKLIHLGKVVMDDDYYQGIMYNSSAQYSRQHSEEGMGLNPKI